MRGEGGNYIGGYNVCVKEQIIKIAIYSWLFFSLFLIKLNAGTSMLLCVMQLILFERITGF